MFSGFSIVYEILKSESDMLILVQQEKRERMKEGRKEKGRKREREKCRNPCMIYIVQNLQNGVILTLRSVYSYTGVTAGLHYTIFSSVVLFSLLIRWHILHFNSNVSISKVIK